MSAMDRPPPPPEIAPPAGKETLLARAAVAGSQPRHPSRVCIATLEINGPSRNGGIGTAYTALAEALAGAGHDVTVLYLQGRHVDRHSIGHWVRQFQARGVRLVPLDEAGCALGGSRSLALSYRAYEWLRRQDFDTIHFHEWLGFGYFSLLARRQGLAFATTRLCVGVHSPTLWLREANQEFLDDLDLLECDALERRCVELADVVWSPSRYLLGWMHEHGWPQPKQSFVQPYLAPANCLDGPQGGRHSYLPGRPVDELVFFGRLEVRKGLVLFCDALDRLAGTDVPAGLAVTFMGRACPVHGRPAADYLSERGRRWPFRLRLLTGHDHAEALAYLGGPRRLAIIPSPIDNAPLAVTECLAAGIPFLASRVGGIPEVIAEEDRERILFSPHPANLAASLADALRTGVRPAQPALDADTNQRFWVDWHANSPARLPAAPPAPVPQRLPRVSVCLVHHDRPTLLRQALHSLQEQDYRNLEVVLVDDGSTEPAALALLRELEPLFQARGWVVLRQENRYLGAARNAAAHRATGAYLLFMDDDNCAKPHEVSTLVGVAERTSADIVTAFMDMFEGDNPPQPGQVPCCRWLFAGTDSLAAIARNCFGDANALVRRTTFDRLGGFTEDHGVTHEDWEFFARAVLAGCRLEVVPEALFWYRLAPDSMIHSTPPRLNYERSLRPYLEDLPAVYHDLLRLAQGQALRNEQLREQVARLGGAGKPLRYRLADLLHGWLGRIPLVRRLLRGVLWTLWRLCGR